MGNDAVTFRTSIFRTKAQSPRTTDDWQLVDLGEILISGPIEQANDNLQILSVVIEIRSNAATAKSIRISDVILIPVDEWSGDFYRFGDEALDEEIVWAMDADSISSPKHPSRALYRDGDGNTRDAPISQDIVGMPTVISNSSPILQANTTQRIWFLFAQTLRVEGTHDGANNASTLTDSTADFVNQGVEAGMIIENSSDNSKATITGVTATTITGTLLDGSDNDWDTNDIYLIRVPTVWVSRPEIVGQIYIQKNQRYLGMRGER